MSLFKRSKQRSLEEQLLFKIQTRMEKIVDRDDELFKKATRDIESYLETFSTAFDLHLETIKDIKKELKIKWNHQEKLDRLKESVIFSRIVANEQALLRFFISCVKGFKKSEIELAKDLGLKGRNGIDPFYKTFKNAIAFSLFSYLNRKEKNTSAGDLLGFMASYYSAEGARILGLLEAEKKFKSLGSIYGVESKYPLEKNKPC